MKDFRLSAIAVVALPLVFACAGDDLTLPSEGAPARIVVLDGADVQRGKVSTKLDSLTFLVTDTQNRPVPGVTVNFGLTEDRGGGSVAPASAETNGQGQVKTQITLGTQVGSLTGEARVKVPDGSTPVSVQFTATALSNDAHQISILSGDPQSAPVGAPLRDPLIVKVTDNFGNGIPGVTITWEAVGGGSVSETSTVTGDNGETSVTRTLGPTAGEQQTQASADGLAGSPVTFTHTALAGNVSSVNIVSGNDQEAPAGSKLPKPLVVRLLDEDGNPIVDRAVTWVVGTGGGTTNPETSQTGPDGQASTEWTLGPTPGNNTLNAVVSGLTPAAFKATGTGTGSPTNLAVTTQPPSSVTAGATLSPGPVVQVRDAAGHDLAVGGIEVTVSISSGKGQLSGTTTVATDPSGQAHFNDLKISGATGSHKLIFAADGLRSATSNKIDVEKTSTSTQISQSSESSNAGELVTVNFTVTSAAGIPTGQVEVTASGGPESCTATVAEGHCDLTLTAPGPRTLTATYKGDDMFASSSASVSHQVNPSQNFPPIANDDIYGTSPGMGFHAPDETRASLIANDADLEGGPLTTTPGTFNTTAGGVVTIGTDGSFDYTPPAAPVGEDSFDYTVNDPSGGSDVGTAFISIR